MKKIITVSSVGSLLCIASYFLPWIIMNKETSWSGYNISDVTKYFSDGKSFEFIFNLTHLVFVGSVACLILQYLDKQKQSKWIGFVTGLAGLVAYSIIKMGLHDKTFELGYTLGFIGCVILLLQTFIGFFRKPLAG